MDDQPVKRKRGRPRKKTSNDSLVSITELKSDTNTNGQGFNFGFQIFKEVMKLPKLKPFLEQPNINLYGLQHYYEVIKKPIWLGEVSRKFTCNEYKSLADFICDMRLLINNGYTFWGHNHKFSKILLRIEHVFEQQLSKLPERVKKTISNLPELQDESFKLSEECKGQEELTEPQIEKNPEVNELLKWEQEVLVNKQHGKQIKLFWMLPEIGQFIALVKHILEFSDISQYEIERMLLMPKESNTLAIIMTAMLCPYAVRANLCLKPIMNYEVWSEMLKKKVDHWYNIYYKYVSPVEVFKICGVEPLFWAAMGLINPLSESEFHELTFYQKAWLLKALCCYTYHSNKRIEVAFNVVEESSLKACGLFDDTSHHYFCLFSPEIRVYKQRKNYGDTEVLLDGSEACSGFIHGEVFPGIFDESKFSGKSKYCPPLYALPRKKDFCLVADSPESLDKLADSMRKKKSIVNALERIKNRYHDEVTMKGLSSLYKQWHEFRERSQASIDLSLEYWLTRNSSVISESNGGECNRSLNETQVEVTGKRIQRRKVTNNISEVCSSDSGSDESVGSNSSDWEDRNIKRKVRRRVLKNACKIKSCEDILRSGLKKINVHPAKRGIFSINNFLVGKLQKSGLTISKKKISEDNNKINIVNAAIPNDSINVSSQMNKPGISDVLTISLKEKDITISRVHPPDENSENTLPQPSISIISASPSMKPHNSRSIDNSSMMSGNIEVQPYLDTDKPVSSNITYSNLVNNNISSGDDGFSPSSLNRFLPIEIDEKHQKFGYFLPTDNDKFEESETKNLQLSPVHFDAQFFPESVCQELFSHPTASNCSRIQGNLVVRAMSDGSFGYAVRLPDGGIINVTNEEILRIKAKNGGIIPKIVTIPIVDLSTVSPLYDDLQTKSLHEQ